MTVPNRIKVGIIGLGRAGWGMHTAELERFREMFQITAACDVDFSRAEALQNRCGADVHIFSDHRALIADPAVELVAIACRSPEHTQYALEALKAGKSVVLDKPIALTYADARKLLAAGKKYPGRIFCRQNRRFEREFNHVLEILHSGMLGEVYLIRHSIFSYQRRNDWQTLLKCGGGQLNNWGPHLIDHALQLLDSKVKTVQGILKKVTALGDAEDFFKILFTGRNGRILDVEFSGGAALPSNVYELHGTRGSLILPPGPDAEFHLRCLDPAFPLVPGKADAGNPPFPGDHWSPYRNPEELHWIDRHFPVAPHNDDTIETIYRHVYNAIRLGVPYRVKLEEAVEVVRVTELVRQQNPKFAQDHVIATPAKPRRR